MNRTTRGQARLGLVLALRLIGLLGWAAFLVDLVERARQKQARAAFRLA